MNILIIGGGVAGATAARILAKYFNVTLIQDKIWNKPCGGGVKTKIFEEFKIPKKLIKHKFSTIYMHYKHSTIPIDLKGENLSIVFREEFDNTLRILAKEAGTNLMYARLINIENSTAIIRKENEILKKDFDILIAADGVNSTVRKKLNLSPIPKIITNFNTTNFSTNTCHFYFDKKFAGNYYAWIFPHQNLSHIGCAGKENFYNFAQFLNVPIKPKGYPIPLWNNHIQIQTENIFFVGDSAGQVMPLSFEGIYYAMHSAKVLATAIIEKRDYKTLWQKRFYKKFMFMKTLQSLLENNIFRNFIISAHKIKFIRDLSINLWL
jgi:geranylgeranyl reductase